jgi:O-methyltransferase involved in polyketide biosynthesis
VDAASLARVGAARNPWTEALRLHVLVRSRYAEDRLAEAVRAGVRQFVSLGAGYDTFAYRQPAVGPRAAHLRGRPPGKPGREA